MPINHASKYSELTEDQFALIGKVVVEWSNIEFLLGVLLSRLLFTNEFLGRIFTDDMGASRIQEAINKALDIHRHRYGCKVVSLETINEINQLNIDIETFRGVRNKFSHFCWSRSTDEELFGTSFSGFISPNKRAKKDSMVISNTEIKEFYQNAYMFVERLSQLIEKLPEIHEEEILTRR
jgi:hypothetical protein